MWEVTCDEPVRGRYVSVWKYGTGVIVTCEVLVFGGESVFVSPKIIWVHSKWM